MPTLRPPWAPCHPVSVEKISMHVLNYGTMHLSQPLQLLPYLCYSPVATLRKRLPRYTSWLNTLMPSCFFQCVPPACTMVASKQWLFAHQPLMGYSTPHYTPSFAVHFCCYCSFTFAWPEFFCLSLINNFGIPGRAVAKESNAVFLGWLRYASLGWVQILQGFLNCAC